MRKMMKCRDVGMDCDFQAHGKTDDEVVRNAAQHAREKHGLATMPPDLEKKVRAAIKEQRLP
jgi:predicted small metal-binding protein